LDANWEAVRAFSPDDSAFELRSGLADLPRTTETAPHSNWSDDTEIVVSSKWLNSHAVDYQSSSQ